MNKNVSHLGTLADIRRTTLIPIGIFWTRFDGPCSSHLGPSGRDSTDDAHPIWDLVAFNHYHNHNQHHFYFINFSFKENFMPSFSPYSTLCIFFFVHKTHPTLLSPKYIHISSPTFYFHYLDTQIRMRETNKRIGSPYDPCAS